MNHFAISGLDLAGAARRDRGFGVLGVHIQKLQQLDWYMPSIDTRLRTMLKTFVYM